MLYHPAPTALTPTTKCTRQCCPTGGNTQVLPVLGLLRNDPQPQQHRWNKIKEVANTLCLWSNQELSLLSTTESALEIVSIF